MFTILRTLSNLLVVLGVVLIVVAIGAIIIMFANHSALLIILSAGGSMLITGIGFVVSGEFINLQIAIYDQLAEHTRLLKRLVNLNLPVKQQE